MAPCRSFHGHVNWLLEITVKYWPRVGAWTGTFKNPTIYLWRWEPDRRSYYFFSPHAHICAVSFINEISLHVTLSNQSHSLTIGNVNGVRAWPRVQLLLSACTCMCRAMLTVISLVVTPSNPMPTPTETRKPINDCIMLKLKLKYDYAKMMVRIHVIHKITFYQFHTLKMYSLNINTHLS